MLRQDFDLKVKDLCKRNLILAMPDENLHDIMAKMIKHKIGRVLIVEENNPKKLIGIITRSDILKAHEIQSLSYKIKS
ncbi:MAG: CBS domain-containing protein [Candidatus Helarchaeota archaeon]